MPPPDQLWHLMARSLSGETTVEEEQELKLRLQNNFSLQQQYDLLERFWNKPNIDNKESENSSSNTDKNIARIVQLANKNISPNVEFISSARRRKKRTSFYYAATALIIICCATIYFWQYKSINKEDSIAGLQVLTAPNGSRSKTILPDGSVVWLNGGSKIYYNKTFSGKLREVKLEGEAFFDIQHNEQKPFIVHTSGINIKVLGTAFNVKSYPEDTTVETTLIRGLVQVSSSNDKQGKPIFLHPNEKIIINKSTKAITSNKSEDLPIEIPVQPISFKIIQLNPTGPIKEPIETAWVDNRLVFKGDNFELLGSKLERWYNVTIVFEDEKVKRLNFTGSFENETVQQAFSALKTATAFNYTIKDTKIYISSK